LEYDAITRGGEADEINNNNNNNNNNKYNECGT